MHWAQNTAKQYFVNRQRNTCLKKNPEDDDPTKEALQLILNDNSEDLENLFARMQKFNANIVGSNACFCKCRSKLEALMEQEGILTT